MKKRESVTMENYQNLMDQNNNLKIHQIKKASGNDKTLRNRINEIERDFHTNLSSKDQVLRAKEKDLRRAQNESRRFKGIITEMETKMKLREEEISLLEEKILGLQKNIR